MHDIRFIRDDPEAFTNGLMRRGLTDARTLTEEILDRDHGLRALQTRLQEAQARRNTASKEIGQAKAKKDEAKASALMAEVAGLKDEIQKGEEEERKLKGEFDDLLASLPNIPAADVPDGADENANVEVKTRAFGDAPRANFPPKEHFDLGEKLGLMDFAAAAKVAGSRFVYLKGALARLERALGNFMLDLHTSEFGYTEIQPPLMVRDDAAFGTGQLPKFEDDLFISGRTLSEYDRKQRAFFASLTPPPSDQEAGAKLTGIPANFFIAPGERNFEMQIRGFLSGVPFSERLWLIPTAEVPLTNYVREEILDEKTLPLRFCAWTPCFRAEAGAAGKDTRGMIRMHQFWKVELVSITTPEQSNAEHERMTDCAQEVLKRLNLPHRVVTLCTGDMGFTAKKTYDIEVWLPGQDNGRGRFREISSCSNCGGFQARRMNTRFRGVDGKVKGPVHTLNGSALAVGRTLIAIMENYQEPDGGIRIPDVLRPYMGGLEKIAAGG